MLLPLTDLTSTFNMYKYHQSPVTYDDVPMPLNIRAPGGSIYLLRGEAARGNIIGQYSGLFPCISK